MESSRPESGWYRDPSGRHDHRWWNGTEWTPHVMTLGLRSVDFGRDSTAPATTAEGADDSAPHALAEAEPDATGPDATEPEPDRPVGPAPRPAIGASALALAGAVLLVVGALLPWAEATSPTASFSSAGIDGNGSITLLAGILVVLAVVLVRPPARTAACVLGLAAVALAVGVHEALDTSRKADDLVARSAAGVSAGVGVGVWVTLAGALLVLVGGIVALLSAKRVPAGRE